jgi:predicted dehydrogenase
VENTCPYSAKRFYFDRLDTKQLGWPLDVVDPEMTKATLSKALREGPYGRCVFACDNDVVDNQVVNMEFEGGTTASFSMMACSEYTGRKTTIFGTMGGIRGDSSKIELYDYLSGETSVIDTEAGDAGFAGGHGGGDTNVLSAFVDAVTNEDPTLISSGPEVSLESHMMVFAAEKSRNDNRVMFMRDFYNLQLQEL